MKKIGAIANGINIDHIPDGNAWKILKLLKLEPKYPVGIGLNLPSQRMGTKDLLKIENIKLNDQQLRIIGVFAAGATYSEIENFIVSKKLIILLPDTVSHVIVCPNHRCISHQHRSLFLLSRAKASTIIASCHYCAQQFTLQTLNKFNI